MAFDDPPLPEVDELDLEDVVEEGPQQQQPQQPTQNQQPSQFPIDFLSNSASRTLTLAERIHSAAKEGLAITVYALLANQSRPEQSKLLATPTVDSDSGQSTTPLIIGTRCGHEKVVHTLLTKFQSECDLGQTGTVKFDCYLIEGASALWCAAGAGHKKIVEMLVKAGADVNQPTKSDSTPLRAASFEGRAEIVEFLIDAGADINFSNKYNNSCLMIAAYKGHLEVVKLLLKRGADPNKAANCGATAMHFAAESGHAEVVRELFNGGAVMSKTEETKMTPLAAAAERCRADVVEYIVSRPEVLKLEKIDALELLGASYANDKDNYDTQLAFKYLDAAMALRWEDDCDVIKKPVRNPVSAYDNRVECEAPEDLNAIRNFDHEIHMEGLAIRERILGPENPEVPHPIIFRGAVFADAKDFDRCIALWIHALKLRQATKAAMVNRDLLRFAQVFSQILQIGGIPLKFEDIFEVIQACVVEFDFIRKKLANPGPKDDPEVLLDEFESVMYTFIYLLVIYSHQSINDKVSDEAVKESNRFETMKVIFKAVKADPRTRNGSSLLHLAVNSETPVDDFHTNDVVHLPSAALTKMLLKAGADPSTMDNDRNTPLHRIVAFRRILADFLTLHTIISSLLEAGAHVDVVNNRGLTPIQCATTNVSEIILKSQVRFSLKCLAAQAVKRHKLKYGQGQVPADLEAFIDLHGP